MKILPGVEEIWSGHENRGQTDRPTNRPSDNLGAGCKDTSN